MKILYFDIKDTHVAFTKKARVTAALQTAFQSVGATINNDLSILKKKYPLSSLKFSYQVADNFNLRGFAEALREEFLKLKEEKAILYDDNMPLGYKDKDNGFFVAMDGSYVFKKENGFTLVL